MFTGRPIVEYLLAGPASPSPSEAIWIQLLLGGLFLLAVNGAVLLARRAFRLHSRRRAENIPKIKDLSIDALDENFFQLTVSPPPAHLADSGVRIAVAAQVPGDASRRAITEPTYVPHNTVVIPRDLVPVGSILWVNWVVGMRVGPNVSIRISQRM